MPGKVNPVLPEVVLQVCAQVIGNDTAITVGGLQGQFELNVRIPLIARNLLQSIHLLSTTSALFAEKCVDGHRGQPRGLRALRGGHARRRDRAEPVHRLRQGGGHRQGRVEAAARCARSRASTASTRRRSTRPSTCARSPRARRRRTELHAAGAHRRVLRRRPPGGVARRGPRGAQVVRQGGSRLAVLRAPDPGRRLAGRGRDRGGPHAPARSRRAGGARVDPRDPPRAARRRARGAPEGPAGAADGARGRALAHARAARRRDRPPARRRRPGARRQRRGAVHRLRAPRHRGRRGRPGASATRRPSASRRSSSTSSATASATGSRSPRWPRTPAACSAAARTSPSAR